MVETVVYIDVSFQALPTVVFDRSWQRLVTSSVVIPVMPSLTAAWSFIVVTQGGDNTAATSVDREGKRWRPFWKKI